MNIKSRDLKPASGDTTCSGVTLATGDAPVVAMKVANESGDQGLDLPAPFVRIEVDPSSCHWMLDTELADLAPEGPSEEQTLFVYRTGSRDPFQWTFEVYEADLRIAWLLDERSGERARLTMDRRNRTLHLVEEQAGGKWRNRVLRNIFASWLVSDGWFPLHASSFKFEDTLFVCVGGRGAGKSTLSLLAGLQGGAFLSDDITFLRPSRSSDHWDALGWPGRFAIRREVLKTCFGGDRTHEIEQSCRRGLTPDSGEHPRGARLAMDNDEVENLLGIRYSGISSGDMRLVHLDSHDAEPVFGDWTSSKLDAGLEIQGRNRRHLVDFFGFYGGEDVANQPSKHKVFEVPIEECQMRLPRDIVACQSLVWEHFGRVR